jgi:hypothetical protein
MTTSTIPTATKRKEIVRHGPSSLCLRTTLVHSQWDRPKKEGTSRPSHHAGEEEGSRVGPFGRLAVAGM